MKRLKLVLLGAVALLLATATPAGAITYGQPDAGEHPYVGFMIFFDPAEPGWFSCSGTLLDADTFLTAAHCTYGIGTKGEVSPRTSGGTDVWVTFQEQEVLKGWPARADYPTEEALLAAAQRGSTRTARTRAARPIRIRSTTTSPTSRSPTTLGWSS